MLACAVSKRRWHAPRRVGLRSWVLLEIKVHEGVVCVGLQAACKRPNLVRCLLEIYILHEIICIYTYKYTYSYGKEGKGLGRNARTGGQPLCGNLL